MNSSRITLIGTALLAGALAGCSSEDKAKETAKPAAAAAPAATPAPEKPLTAEESADIIVTATVKAINQTTREVTLKDASGNEITIIADKAVKRLNEVKVGDNVTANYHVSLLGELRPPTAEETANPIQAVAVAGRTPQGATPAGGAARAVKVVTTVQAVDLAKMLVTVQGPMGESTIIHARKPENVKKLHVGDTIVFTYTEALAISLEKAPAKK